MKKISFVIPSYNEAGSLKELLHKLSDYFAKNKSYQYDILLIDDGSTDETYEIIQNLKGIFKNKLLYVRFYKNFGKTIALAEGFERANGDYIITMDADLQDDPNEIDKIIKKLNLGYDLVIGRKKKRQDAFLTKKIPSYIFNLMIKILFKIEINDINSGFKGYKKDLAKNLKLSNDFHRLIPLISHIYGYSITEVDVNHRKRKYGKSKYGFLRFFNGIIDFLYLLYFKYFVFKPLHFYGFTGLLFSFVGFSILTYLFVIWVNGSSIGTRPLFSISILAVILGLFSFMIGFVAQKVNQNGSFIKIIKKKVINFEN